MLPVGGIKEKVLAAYRAGVRTVLLPERNEKDILEDIPPEIREEMTIHYVSRAEEVLRLALEDAPSRNDRPPKSKRVARPMVES